MKSLDHLAVVLILILCLVGYAVDLTILYKLNQVLKALGVPIE